MKVSKKSTIEEILKSCPQAIEIFRKYQMECYACMGAAAESLEKGALAHGIDADILVNELNRLSQPS
ncbi:MAG: DUF1858 domain-containing protein [bacterium]